MRGIHSLMMSGAAGLAGVLIGIPAASAAVVTQPGDTIGGGQLSGSTFTVGTTGTTAGANNFPAAENPPSAIDGVMTAANKYLNFAQSNTGYIVTPAGGLSKITGISLFTGNDAPERDPVTFSLYGSNTVTASSTAAATFDLTTSFTAIVTNASTNLTTDPGRSAAAPAVTFSNALSYKTYILVFPTVRTPTSANSMQIGEADLTGTFVPEPAAMGLLGVSLAGLLARRRRPSTR